MSELTFLDLVKACRVDIDGKKPLNLSLLGDTSTQQLAIAIKGYARLNNINLEIFDAPYNQIDAQLLDKESECLKSNPDIILLYLSSEKLYDKFLSLSQEKRSSFANDEIKIIKNYWSHIKQNSNAKIMQYNFVYINDEVFGSLSTSIENGFSYQIQKLNCLLSEEANKTNVQLVDLNGLQSKIGRDKIFDDKLYFIAKMAICTNALSEVAKITIPVIKCYLGDIKKCVILDLDNTLWGGIIGDDGIENIEIGDFETGRAFSAFQRYLKELKERGIILAVCSKNDKDVAMRPFKEHKDMILKLEDIAIFIANWEDKASNIKAIQQTLNISMDSIVFVDDSEFERNSVKALIPNLCVPDMPQDPALYVSYLQSLKLFETITYSEEDKARTNQYKDEYTRRQEQSTFSDYKDYLKSLDMVAEVKPFDGYTIPRVAQLSQRSNQFNLRTIRYTQEEIDKITKDPNYITRSFSLKDRIGDYGLIAAVILKKQEDWLFIDTLIMSCRVLKRGMEEFIFNEISSVAKKENLDIVGEYIKTEKNALVANLLSDMGFEKKGDKYFLAKDNKIIRDTFVKREEND